MALFTVPAWPRTRPKDPVSHSVTTWTATCGSATSIREGKDVRNSRTLLAELGWSPPLPHSPALRSTSPHAVSFITLQRTFVTGLPLCSQRKLEVGNRTKGRSLQNAGMREPMPRIWVWAYVWRGAQGLGKHEDGVQRELNPHLSAQAAISRDSHKTQLCLNQSMKPYR